jgi:hypothetical protein
MSWDHDAPRSFTLSAPTVENFKVAIAKFQGLLGQESDARYIAIPVGSSGNLDIGSVGTKAAVQALFDALSTDGIRGQLDLGQLDKEVASALSGRVRISELQNGVLQLRTMLDSGVTKESEYQKWFDQHYWAFGNAYIAKDDVRAISQSDNVDMLLEQTASGMRDIIELKRPDMPVLQFDKDHRNYYFSAHVSSAIGQCHRYLEVFSDNAKHGLLDASHIVSHYPEAIIVIGRSHDWDDKKQKELRGLNSRLSGIKVMTFDHMLAQAEAMIKLVVPRDAEKPKTNGVSSYLQDLDDEIPF